MSMNSNKWIGSVVLAATMALTGGCAHTGSEYSRSTGEKIDDHTIARNVKSALKRDSLLKGADINVSSYRSDVILSGFVDYDVQKVRASEVARAVPAVRWFQNQIVVKSESPFAKAAQSSTNAVATPESVNWERGIMNYYGKPPSSSAATTGAGRSTSPENR